ncbi:unnamed protein product [Hymenolepis diminuta]|uniref:protein xylosyltransferase n=1 Tax=Hymenolepis diminuta TaxID=6216 RepID=A0A564Y7G7_HYMDI|nr:unnamed protein product [Hymenolepis diminuta]
MSHVGPNFPTGSEEQLQASVFILGETSLNEDLRHVGCYYYERAKAPLKLVFYNETELNSIRHCVHSCKWAGLAYAGLAEGTLCYCDRQLPVFMILSKEADSIPCPAGYLGETCGGKNAIDIYATGVAEDLVYSAPTLSEVNAMVSPGGMTAISNDFNHVRIVYVLILTGRSWRQVQRMFRLIYHTSNYFYIHVDLKSEYLYSRCKKLEEIFPNNVRVTSNRQNPIWGAPSLLGLIMDVLQDLFKNFPHWKWDFFINLSETDLPVMPVWKLIRLLNSHRGRIFLRQSSEEIFKYIHSEGLGYAFLQCGNYIWRVGQRSPLDGIVIHGGSDWLILPRAFAYYSVYSNDSLVRGLRAWFQNAILPVESFFHTLAYNSHFCDRIVNANLRMINWQRPRGCSCKKTSIADWCGCSPSVFSGPQAVIELLDVLNRDASPVAFARKFDSTIDVAMVNYMERKLLKRQLPFYEDADLYLESVYSAQFDGHRAPFHVLEGIGKLIRMACNCSVCSGILSSVCNDPNEIDPRSQPTEVYALFNATKSLGELNYTILERQIAVDGFLPTSSLATPLPLRLLNHPSLVLRFADKEVLYLPSSTPLQSWVSLRSLEHIEPGEIYYFEVGSNFDAKELVFRNYLRFPPRLHSTTTPTVVTSPLTLLLIWRDSKAPPSPLNITLASLAETSSFCNFTLLRNNHKDAPYPGLPGFRSSFLELDLSSCALPNNGNVSFKILVNEHGVNGTAMSTIFSELVEINKLWKVVEICKMDECSSKVWSPSRVDRKSALGCLDAGTGLLHVGKIAATLFDFPI